MANSPCKHCKERYFGCHSECERYKEYDELNKKIRELRLVEFNKINYDVDTSMKIRKIRHSRKRK